MFKKFICILLALTLAVGLAGGACAQPQRDGIRFTVTGPETLWAGEPEGKTAEEMAEAARRSGLEHPITEEKLTAAGARILRENDVIYMIRSIRGLLKARTAQEATEAAWSLVPLLGGQEDMELELYTRLNIGNSGIYCFSQVRNGEPVFGRMLKIVGDAEGNVDTVISSLGFPEETDESLGVEDDLLGQMLMEAETPEVPDFDRMIPGEWTCEGITDAGEPVKVTVPVMQDPENGLWILGDRERKIVLGDFKKMVLEGEADCLLTSAENSGWDPADVMTYHRIIQVWDDLAGTGWTGPDGQGTPVLLLNNLCLISGESMENACYIGCLQGRWQAFAYSQEMGFGRCLDVLAHEAVHCITETSILASLYKDDYGAINEAVSDILGNLCEMRMGETEDTEWNLGENLGTAFRSMSDPRAHNQPAYVWDEFYAPRALYPNDINDRGGVHSNSSILNYTASQLCLAAGMTLEEARDFWMTVVFGLSSRTDYCQMPELMAWALEVTGLESYQEAVTALAEKTRMTLTRMPETAEEGQMLAELNLPDTEVLKDHKWVLTGVQLKTDEALSLVLDLLDSAFGEKEDANPDFLQLLTQLIGAETNDTAWGSPAMMTLMDRIEKIFVNHMTWKSAEGEPLTMVMERGLPTVYALVNMDPGTMEPRAVALLIGEEWVDAGKLLNPEALEGEQMTELLDLAFRLGLDLLFPEDTDRQVLPAEGLEALALPAAEESVFY